MVAKGREMEMGVEFMKVCGDISSVYRLKREARCVWNLLRVSEEAAYKVKSF